MRNLYLLTFLMFNCAKEEATEDFTVMEMIQNTENPPTVSFSNKVSFEDVDEVVHTNADVNIRTKPNIDSDVITSVPVDEELHLVGVGNNGWSKVAYEDGIYYIANDYLYEQEVIDMVLANTETNLVAKNNVIILEREMSSEENVDLEEDMDIDLEETSSDETDSKEENQLAETPLTEEDYDTMISTDGAILSKHIQTARGCLKSIPENVVRFLKENNVAIFITDTNLAQRFFNGQYKSVMGCTVYADKTIYLENRDTAIKNALIHETGHMLDSLLEWPSSSEEFVDCFNTERYSFVEIGRQDNNSISSTMEYFAEVWNQCILYPDSCRASAPKSYMYVSKLMNSL